MASITLNNIDIEKALAAEAKKNEPPKFSVAVHEIPESPTPMTPIEKQIIDSGPPDGGFVAWLQVLLNLLINALSWGYPSAFSVFELYYTETLNLPAGKVSWIGSIQTFLCFVICAPSGRLADAGYWREVTAAGGVLIVVGTFMTSLCTKYWQIFLAQGVCTGIGLGLIYMPAVTVMASYFRKNQAVAMSIGGMGASIGSAIFPAVVQYLIPAIGFPWAVRCLGFIFIVMAGTSFIIIKPRLSPRKGPVLEWSAFKEGPYASYAAGTFVLFWALYFTVFYVQTYATTFLTFDSTSSVQLLITMNAVGVPARGVAGYFQSYFVGPMNVYIISIILLGIATLAWIAVGSNAGMWAFVVCWGLANGCMQGAFGGSLASLTTDPTKQGVRYGMVCTLMAFATLAGPPTAGAMISSSGGSYQWAKVWAGIVTLLAATICGIGRWCVTGNKLFARV